MVKMIGLNETILDNSKRGHIYRKSCMSTYSVGIELMSKNSILMFTYDRC